VDVSDFRTFIEVSRTRHFGQAAQNLCITQSAVSARIRQLEDALGKKLFIRQRNNIQLTPEGEQLLTYAETIVTAWNRARQTIGISEKDSVSLVIGGMPGLWDMTLQDWLHQVYAENDKLVMHAELHGAGVLHRRVLNGTMDLAFVYDVPVNDQLAVKVVSDIPLKLVSSYPDKSAKEATEENYIMVDWGTSFLNGHTQHFSDIPVPMLYTHLGRIAFDFILANGGSAYLAEPMFDEDVQKGRLHIVKDAPVFQRTAYAIYRTDNEKQEFIKHLIETSRQSIVGE
jgi:DNA-binding transcriptional LysR family regulator